MTDGFTIVKTRGRRRKAELKKTRSLIEVDCVEVDVLQLVENIHKVKHQLTTTGFLPELFSLVSEDFPHISDVLCLGLGSFAHDRTAKTQLAVLCGIQEHFNCRAIAYDPIFTPYELSALEALGIKAHTSNEEGKHKILPGTQTLAFFPHCPKQLVNNFLWTNWNPSLHECVIISNSFKNIIERNTTSELSKTKCIVDIIKITKEVTLPYTDETSIALNDTAIHTFPKHKIVSTDFWSKREEPEYPLQDLEFITKDICVKLKDLKT